MEGKGEPPAKEGVSLGRLVHLQAAAIQTNRLVNVSGKLALKCLLPQLPREVSVEILNC